VRFWDCRNIGVTPEAKDAPATDVTTGSADVIDAVDEQLIRELIERARAEGLTGEGGSLARSTKTVVESALEGDWDVRFPPECWTGAERAR
jgi:hypothetical protein